MILREGFCVKSVTWRLFGDGVKLMLTLREISLKCSKYNKKIMEKLDGKTWDSSDMSHGPLRVVVADDQEVNREVVGEYMRGFGYNMGVSVELVEVEDGQSAFNYVSTQGADLVVSDVNMPGGNGPASVEKMFMLPDSPYVAFMTGGSISGEDAEMITRLMNDPRLIGLVNKPMPPGASFIRAFVEMAAVRKGLITSGVLSVDTAGRVPAEVVEFTRAACSMNHIPLSGRWGA